jgi:hypothetical protein
VLLIHVVNLKTVLYFIAFHQNIYLLFIYSIIHHWPTLISLSESVQYVFHHVVIKIRQLFLRPAACLTLTLLQTGVGANDCKCSRYQRLNVPSEALVLLVHKYLFNQQMQPRWKKPHLSPLGSFKDLNRHRDRQREAALFYTVLWNI